MNRKQMAITIYSTFTTAALVSVLGISQASGALTASENQRLKSLEATVLTLKTQLAAQQSSQNNSILSSYREAKIDFFRQVQLGVYGTCPEGSSVSSLFQKEYSIGKDSSGWDAKMVSCTATFLVKR